MSRAVRATIAWLLAIATFLALDWAHARYPDQFWEACRYVAWIIFLAWTWWAVYLLFGKKEA